MKINYKLTALELLKPNSECIFGIPDSNKNWTKQQQLSFGDSITKVLKDKHFKEMMTANVRYITEPFHEAFYKSKGKLGKIFDQEEMEETGTLIYKRNGATLTIFYMLMTHGKGENWRYNMLYFQFCGRKSMEGIPNLDIAVTRKLDDDEEIITTKSFFWKGFEDNGMCPDSVTAELITLLLFIKYCDIETKVVNAKRKEVFKGEKYVNETDCNIQIMDCSWFTEIIHNEAFNVSGHFRWQPYGPGSTQRRLQYIPEYTKQGYHRKARKPILDGDIADRSGQSGITE